MNLVRVCLAVAWQYGSRIRCRTFRCIDLTSSLLSVGFVDRVDFASRWYSSDLPSGGDHRT